MVSLARRCCRAAAACGGRQAAPTAPVGRTAPFFAVRLSTCMIAEGHNVTRLRCNVNLLTIIAKSTVSLTRLVWVQVFDNAQSYPEYVVWLAP